MFDAILNREPAPVMDVNPNLPADFWRILSKLLEKDRTLRCQTATELKTDLNRLKRDLESGTQARGGIEPTRSRAVVKPADEVGGGAVFREFERRERG